MAVGRRPWRGTSRPRRLAGRRGDEHGPVERRPGSEHPTPRWRERTRERAGRWRATIARARKRDVARAQGRARRGSPDAGPRPASWCAASSSRRRGGRPGGSFMSPTAELTFDGRTVAIEGRRRRRRRRSRRVRRRTCARWRRRLLTEGGRGRSDSDRRVIPPRVYAAGVAVQLADTGSLRSARLLGRPPSASSRRPLRRCGRRSSCLAVSLGSDPRRRRGASILAPRTGLGRCGRPSSLSRGPRPRLLGILDDATQWRCSPSPHHGRHSPASGTTAGRGCRPLGRPGPRPRPGQASTRTPCSKSSRFGVSTLA